MTQTKFSLRKTEGKSERRRPKHRKTRTREEQNKSRRPNENKFRASTRTNENLFFSYRNTSEEETHRRRKRDNSALSFFQFDFDRWINLFGSTGPSGRSRRVNAKNETCFTDKFVPCFGIDTLSPIAQFRTTNFRFVHTSNKEFPWSKCFSKAETTMNWRSSRTDESFFGLVSNIEVHIDMSLFLVNWTLCFFIYDQRFLPVQVEVRRVFFTLAFRVLHQRTTIRTSRSFLSRGSLGLDELVFAAHRVDRRADTTSEVHWSFS